MIRSAAEILREYGPFPGIDNVHGVTFDGQHVWFASGDKLNALDPHDRENTALDRCRRACRNRLRRPASVSARRGSHPEDRSEDRPRARHHPGARPGGDASGLAWAEGTLWVAQYRDRKIHQIDPANRSNSPHHQSNRFVTGVTWIDGELWHGTWEADESDLRRVDPRTGALLETLEMPPGTTCRAWNPMAATGSSAAAEAAGK